MQIKCITINIWHGGKLFEELISFLKSENPDVLLLQEVYDGKDPVFENRFRTIDIFREKLGLPFSSFAPTILDREDFGKVPQGNAIFSKFPILFEETTFYDVPFGEYSESEETDWSQWPNNLQHVTLDLGSKKLDVFNTHGQWYLNGTEDTERRLTMSKTILEKIRGKEYVILGGDFNVRPETKTMRDIENHLINVFKNELSNTFNMSQKENPSYATTVVDYLFVSRNIKVLDHQCPPVNISDHLPLVATVEI